MGYYINNPVGEYLINEYLSILDYDEVLSTKRAYINSINKINDIIRPYQHSLSSKINLLTICQDIEKSFIDNTSEYKIELVDKLDQIHASEFRLINTSGESQELVAFLMYSTIFWKKIK